MVKSFRPAPSVIGGPAYRNDTTNSTPARPAEVFQGVPITDDVDNQTIPYRGQEAHGVHIGDYPTPDVDHLAGEPVHVKWVDPDPLRIDGVVRTIEVQANIGWTNNWPIVGTNGAGTQKGATGILHYDKNRKNCVLVNSGNNTVWLGFNSSITDANGFWFPAGATLGLDLNCTLFAYALLGADSRISVIGQNRGDV